MKNNLDSRVRESQELADRAINLIQFNRINTKNAFDVNNSFIENSPMILNQNEESSWQRASALLDACTKIYGYRVDSVHTLIFKFLGGLNRSKFNEEGESGRKRHNEEIDNNTYDKTIEKDMCKLDLTSYDLEFSVDPLFKNMTAKFNQTGVSKLLYKILPLNENLDILFESKENEKEQSNFIDKAQFNEDMKNILKEKIDKDDIRRTSICLDFTQFKSKYKIENKYRGNTFLEELLKEEVEDFIMEEAPEESYEDEENIEHNDEQIDDNILKDNNEIDNNDNKENLNEDKADQCDLVVEINNDVLNNENLEMKDTKSDWKTNLLLFGDGNVNLLKDFSQAGPFKLNFSKNKNYKKLFKIDDNEQKPTVKDKQNELFDFRINKLPETKEIFKKYTGEKSKGENESFLRKKRKILNLYHLESSLSFHYFMTDIVQIKHDKRRTLKSQSFLNNMNEDKFLDDPEIDNGCAYVEEDDCNFMKGNKVKNRLFDGKFGKLYRTFNLQVLKNRMWELLQKMWKNNENHTDSPNEVYFNNILTMLDKESESDLKEKITRQTCFVCMLHLANEKGLVLEEVTANNFKIMI